MSSNMRGGWKVNATEYNRQQTLEQRYRQTSAFKAKNGFAIYVILLTLTLLTLFG